MVCTGVWPPNGTGAPFLNDPKVMVVVFVPRDEVKEHRDTDVFVERLQSIIQRKRKARSRCGSVHSKACLSRWESCSS